VGPDDDLLEALVAAAAEGDNVALGELVRRTQPSVWRVCSALGSPGEEADLVQETYLRAVGSVASYRAEAPVTVWLASIARRVCADDVRRRQRRRRLVDRLAASAHEHHVPAPQVLDDLLAALEPDRREAFVLTQYVGLSYEEAAGVLDCPIGTIRSRVSRGRADLAAMVAHAEAL
jgi:RNA polymerase sigma-70 factor (ECF subfamily)